MINSSGGISNNPKDIMNPNELSNLLGSVFDSLSEQIAVLDNSGTIILTNQAWKDFAQENDGDRNRTDIGINYLEICQSSKGDFSEGAENVYSGLKAVLDGESPEYSFEYPCPSPSEDRWFIMYATPLNDSQGGAVISHVDITKRKHLEIELQKLSYTDSLTGILNRRGIEDRLKNEIQRAYRHKNCVSILSLDLDKLKFINDTYGHDSGDRAIQIVANNILSEKRGYDHAGRLGGDEFLIVLPETNSDTAAKVARRIRENILAESLKLDGGQSFQVNVSIGVASLDGKSVDFITARDLMMNGDQALYEAKKDINEKVKIYHPDS